MTNVLIDPTLRRARRVRFAACVLVAAIAGLVAVFVHGLVPEPRAPPGLPPPRRALARVSGRPDFGRRRPVTGQRRTLRPPLEPRQLPSIAPRSIDDPPASAAGPPRVIAFIDPSVPGSLASLEQHAEQIAEAAPTGLLLGDDGTIIDRIDPAVIASARSHRIPISPLLQNLDESDGRWRGDRALALARDPKARRRLAEQLAALCDRLDLKGVHLDLEDLPEDRDGPGYAALAPTVDAVSAQLRVRGRATSVDLPAHLPPGLVARIGREADRVVTMAYDESDADGSPGPIASERFVDAALISLAELPASRRVAGLGVYGYDWVGDEPGDPVSFVEAFAAAKEARAEAHSEGAGAGVSFRFSDDEGSHSVWLLDAVALWNQLAVVRRHDVGAVALWRLGGEDPGVWDALALAGRPPGEMAERIATVPADPRVINLGDGPFLALSLSPEDGARAIVDSEGRLEEIWQRLPSPFLVRRAGLVPGKVALTFDDGPDPSFTPAILDTLRATAVPASFFVIGENVLREPGIVRRELAEGHRIGNHTFTHPAVDLVDDRRLHLELESTSRLLESVIGQRPLLYRPPSLADIEPRTLAGARAFARAGALGYLVVDADVDPRDFEASSAQDLTDRILRDASRGGVVLLHDGGGDRSTTVLALPGIIAGLRARGQSLVPLEELIGKTPAEVTAPPSEHGAIGAIADRAVWGGGSLALTAGVVCLGLGLLLIALRAAVVLVIAPWSARRQRRRHCLLRLIPARPLLPATVVIPAYNERAVIRRTVESVLSSDVPVEVVVVDDGSTDGTAEEVARHFGKEPRVRLLQQPNRGKPAALRAGFACAHGEIVIALDGDTLFAPDTVRRLVVPFADPRVGAVAGTADVGNPSNWLTRVQALEYLSQQEVERRAFDAVAALPVVPGAVGAWRRQAVDEAGGFSSATLAEDADLAMTLARRGWRVVYAPEARARTEAPETVRALVRQRVRWSFGVLQAMWKHRRAMIERRSGALGRVVLPSLFVYQVLVPLLAPLATLAAIGAAIAGHLGPALVASAVLFAVELAEAVLACRLGRRGHRLLPWVVVGRLLYRPLLFAILARSLARALDGTPLGWNKLVRRGTVV